MKKRVISVLLALVIASIPASSVVFADEPVKLVFKALTWIADEQRAQNELIDQWNSEHPEIQVQLAPADWSTASQELLTAFETGDVPDIFHYAQPIIADWKNLGFLEDLSPMLTDEDLADVNEDIWSGLTADDGSIVGVPIQYEVDVTFYDKDVFEKYGIEPPTMEDPWTFDEVVEIARQLQGSESEDYLGMLFPGPDHFGRVFTEVWAPKIGDPLVYQNDDGSYYMKLNDESIAFIGKIKELIDEGIISKDMLSANPPVVDNFLNGKAAMVVGYGCWYRSQFINEAEGTKGINWGVAAPIKVNDTNIYGYIQTLSIPSASKHKEEAMEFLKWYWSKENVLDVARAAYIMPGRNSAIEDESLNTPEYGWDLCQEAVSHNVLPDYVKLPGWGQVTEGVGNTILGEYFAGGATLEDTISNWEKQATRILNEAAED